jgi:arylsulfatase
MSSSSNGIRRRDFLGQVVAGTLCALVPACAKSNERQSGSGRGSSRPNVLLIVADDVGYGDIGAYGSEIPTPNLDRLADEGTLFTNFHVAAVCSPTRAMLLTGVDNHLAGMGGAGGVFAVKEQQGKSGYEGHLNQNVVTVATLLKEAGYHTYMAGKWHLGTEQEHSPHAKGFERTFALINGAANNFDACPLWGGKPLYRENGKPASRPPNYYSTDLYTDKIIEYIKSNQSDTKPFFAYLSFQVTHWPCQAPRKYIEMFEGRYANGWDVVRQQRFERMKRSGLVPENLKLPPRYDIVPAWNNLSAKQKKYEAQLMAVYAGMVRNMDDNIGRLLDFLKQTGRYDNTLILFLSDNGPDPIAPLNVEYVKRWFDENGLDNSLENMGNADSMPAMGVKWAQVGAVHLRYAKISSAEGGLRVPLITASPGRIASGARTDALTFVKDIAPTILDAAGVKHPGSEYRGRKIHPVTGHSMQAILAGRASRVHDQNEAIGYEYLGHAAIFRGSYKAVRLTPPFGDRQWELYNISEDPAERQNLAQQKPGLLKEMIRLYENYVKENNVISYPPDVFFDIGLEREGWFHRPGSK